MGKEDALRKFLASIGSSDDNQLEPVIGREREYIAETMVHLDLQPGDKVRWVSKEFRDSIFPEVGDVAEVFRVFEPRLRPADGGNHDGDENDFSILAKRKGRYEEYVFDSRRFEKVE